MKKTTVSYLLGVVLGAALFFVLRAFTITEDIADSGRYLTIAQAPFAFSTSPWGYRIGVPAIVHTISNIFSINIPLSFLIVQACCFTAVVAIIFNYFRFKFNLGISSAIILCLLFAFSYTGSYNVHNVMHVGFLEHLIMISGFICLVERKTIFLVMIILTSALIKENIGLLLIPTFAGCTLYEAGFKGFIKKVIPTIIAYIAIFLSLRIGILYDGHVSFYKYFSFYDLNYFEYIARYHIGIVNVILRTYTAFGLMWMTFFIGLHLANSMERPLAFIILPAISQITLAVDIPRMVGLSFPAILYFTSFFAKRFGTTIFFFIFYFNTLMFLFSNHGVRFAGMYGSLTIAGMIGAAIYYRQERQSISQILSSINNNNLK